MFLCKNLDNISETQRIVQKNNKKTRAIHDPLNTLQFIFSSENNIFVVIYVDFCIW